MPLYLSSSMEVQQIASKLTQLEERESINVARILREHSAAWDVLEPLISRINAGEPVQYVVGHAWFYGRKFGIDESVLIPRPETEELVYWIIQENKTESELHLLDIGTGSGCIATTLALELPGASIEAIDISDDAIRVARFNARKLGADVAYRNFDFLESDLAKSYDVIVSNPPYVSSDEFEALAPSVRQFEPSIALGHPSGDPLIFYRAIANTAALKSGGRIYVELNEFRVRDIEQLFVERGYRTELRDDLQGKPRMLKAWK